MAAPKQIYLNYNGKRYRYNLDLSYIDSRELRRKRVFPNLNMPQIQSKIANFSQFKYKIFDKLQVPSKVVVTDWVESIKNIQLTASNYTRLQKIASKATNKRKAEKLLLNLIESQIYKQFKLNNPSLKGRDALRAFHAIKKNLYNNIHPIQKNTATKIKALLKNAKNISLNSLERFFFLAVHKLNLSKEVKADYLRRGFDAIAKDDLDLMHSLKTEIENIAYAQKVDV